MIDARRRADLAALVAALATLAGTAMFAAGLHGRAALAVWALAAAAHTVLPLTPAPPARWRTWLVAGAAAASALALAALPPVWSDDIARYVLDGRVSAAGLHPLVLPPASPKVADLVVGLPLPPNHPALPSIYPPLAQGAFALVFGVAGLGLLGWRLLLTGGLVAIAALDRDACGALPRGLAVAAHPLCLLAVCNEGHVDALGLFALAVALPALRRRASSLTLGLLAGAGAGIKLFPIVWAWAGMAWRHPAGAVVRAASIAAIVFALSAAPLSTAGPSSAGSLSTYSATWTHHASVHALLTEAIDGGLEATGVGSSFELTVCSRHRASRDVVTWYDGQPTHACWVGRRRAAETAARAIGLLVLAAVAWRVARRRPACAVQAMTSLTLTLWLISPVVHPWYLLWLLPLAAWSERRAAWCFVAAALAAYYGAASAHDGAGWLDPAWVRGAAYLPVLAALLFDSRRQPPVVSGAVPMARSPALTASRRVPRVR